MATWKFPLLLLGLSLLTVSATARPCKTLFFFTSASYYPIPAAHSSNPNPNFNLQYPSFSPRFLTFFFTIAPFPDDESKLQYNKPSISLLRNSIFSGEEDQLVEREEEEEDDVSKRSSSMIPVEFYSSVKSSIRDRTKDIMGVMGAMLFGAGCGALTAAMMYLIWSLFWPTTLDFEDSSDDHASPKKMGYVALPTKVVDDDLKKPAKDVV
ncbi:hypothetical protein H5410_005957 [Solanum commersonii]|uniref:Uncharacterized protein n=1 Tax=Solanum commersonii TaxID=4109 RepID=A0A9J6A8X9_SOLCO|nr:hypothetical protein H5410_005957 [Solanum commersonii]